MDMRGTHKNSKKETIKKNSIKGMGGKNSIRKARKGGRVAIGRIRRCIIGIRDVNMGGQGEGGSLLMEDDFLRLAFEGEANMGEHSPLGDDP